MSARVFPAAGIMYLVIALKIAFSDLKSSS